MRIQEVTTAADRKAFLMLPVRLYRDVSQWIRPLDKDIEGVFDQKVNKAFHFGEVIRWILIGDHDEVIGRVAAFFDRKYA